MPSRLPVWFDSDVNVPYQLIDFIFGTGTARELTGVTITEARALARLADPRLDDIRNRFTLFMMVWETLKQRIPGDDSDPNVVTRRDAFAKQWLTDSRRSSPSPISTLKGLPSSRFSDQILYLFNLATS